MTGRRSDAGARARVMPPEPLQYETRTEPAAPGRWFSWRVVFWVLASLAILGVLVYFFLEFTVAGFPAPDSPYDPPGTW